jgi:hypothetical protein
MPKVSQPRTDVIAELGEQLRYGAKKTLVRQLDRIDELAAHIEDDGLYPEDFIVFRITGYRPEIKTPRMLPGAALRGDLFALAERISESAGLTGDDLTDQWVDLGSFPTRAATLGLLPHAHARWAQA